MKMEDQAGMSAVKHMQSVKLLPIKGEFATIKT